MKYPLFFFMLALTACVRPYFVAKIGDEAVFDYEDVLSVCSSNDCMGLDYTYGNSTPGCIYEEKAYTCRYKFSITLNDHAARRIAEKTLDIPISGEYLDENLTFYYGDEVLDSLRIASKIKGSKINELNIFVEGHGDSLETALMNSKQKMEEIKKSISS
ncbi:MAG: hypothetical protein NDI94_01975 [Candidatus Woesearchaeota archaeon]|nr:hypothetical protein [Candidatus Woesearchaeota archaeon]